MKLAALVTSGKSGDTIGVSIVHLLPSGHTDPQNCEPCKRLVVDREKETWGVSNPNNPNTEIVPIGCSRKGEVGWNDVLIVLDLENRLHIQWASDRVAHAVLGQLELASLHQ
ncbi:MAG: hypothetical protein WAV25_03050 [Minisyncoccia bacterium]